jgi:formamidopyrimidine-DNA glycosylase
VAASIRPRSGSTTCRHRDRRGPAPEASTTRGDSARSTSSATDVARRPTVREDGPGAARRDRSTGLSGRALGAGAPIKALLLDQRIVAGLGNIYVCEALNLAESRRAGGGHIARAGSTGSPSRSRRCCSRRSGRRLDLRDYVQPDGELGYFSKRVAGLWPEGQPCRAARSDSPRGRFGPLDLLLPEMPALRLDLEPLSRRGPA